MSRIAAFGDCHIGSYGKKIDEQTGLNARLIDTLNSLDWVLGEARQRGIMDVLFAGDMFRNAKPSPTELCRVQDIFIRHEMLTHAIPGNHDLPRSAGESSAIDPLNGAIDIVDRPGLMEQHSDYQLAFLPYPNRSQLAAALPEYSSLSPEEADRLISAHLETILRGLAAQLVPDKPSILLAHISIDVAEAGAERGIMAGRDITIPLSAIPEEFTFAVLGHIHHAQDFSAYGRPNVLYTGSTDRIDFGEENDPKSYVILDTETGTWERVPIPCREYLTLGYEVCPDGDEGECIPASLEGVICRYRITRPENMKPDYDKLLHWIDGCFDFRGFVEDVQRVASVRSEEITRAQSVEELIRVWHETKSCEVPVEQLVTAGVEMEGSVA